MNLKLSVFSALVAVSALLGACVAQPVAPCAVISSNPINGILPYAVHFTLVGTPTGMGCGDLTFDEMGAQKYLPPGEKVATVALRLGAIGQAIEDGRADPADPDAKKVNAIGSITTLYPVSAKCTINNFSAAEQAFEASSIDKDLPDGGTETVPLAPYTVKYQFGDLTFGETTTVPGTVFEGTATYTLDNCTANYKIDGLWPSISCDDGNGNPDPQACVATADLDAGRAVGSGINPDFKTKCDPVSLHCRLDQTLADVIK
jgi:hypothetical protein